jgi:hypothetical protein
MDANGKFVALRHRNAEWPRRAQRRGASGKTDRISRRRSCRGGCRGERLRPHGGCSQCRGAAGRDREARGHLSLRGRLSTGKWRLELEVSDLGAIQLKNIAEPMRAYLVEVGRPGKPLRRRSALRHRRVASLATLAFLVVAGVAGWDSIAGKPSTTASSPTTPMASSPMASSFDPAVDIIPATGNQPTAPSHAQTRRPVRSALTSQPDAQPTARKVVHSSAKQQPSGSELTQSPLSKALRILRNLVSSRRRRSTGTARLARGCVDIECPNPVRFSRLPSRF